jgi:solute carrier family 35 protein E1
VVQLFLGLPLFIPIWILQPPVFLTNRSAINVQAISLVAFSHILGNVATMYSLSAGSVSFTHVVKSAEPIFTALLSLFLDRVTLSVEVYLSLIPIVVGVALASIKEGNYTIIRRT